MKMPYYLKSSLLIAAVSIFFSHSLVALGSHPNIVVIMADDLGLGDISFHVRSIQQEAPVVETPTLDDLASFRGQSSLGKYWC